MRLTRQIHKPTPPSLNMAAMIDVVFLLLIYFLLTLVFMDPERSLLSQLPNIGQNQATAQVRDFEPVRITLHPAPAPGSVPPVRIVIDGAAVEGYEQLQVELKLRRAIADIPVIIQGDDALPFDYFVRALDACHQADLQNVAFSAGQGDRP